MQIIKRRNITFRDNEKKTLHDRLVSPGGIFVPKKNKVLVHSRNTETGEMSLESQSSNLIVYHGRSWLMQRAFGFPLGAVGDYPWANYDSTDVSASYRDNFHNMYLSWFAVGSGGADMISAPLEPYDTTSCEYELIEHVAIGGAESVDPSGSTSNLRYAHPYPTDATRDYHQFDVQYPQFMFDPDVVPGEGGSEDPNYEQMQIADSTSDVYYEGFKADSYLKALIRVTLAPEECNGPKYYDPLDSGKEYTYLNEAGLYVSTSYLPESVSTDEDNVQMFAKVNFSSVRKDESRELIFSWYIYF